MEHEIELHNKFDVAVNPQFYNRAKQTSTGFDQSEVILSAKRKAEICKTNKGRKHSPESIAKMRLVARLNTPKGSKHPLFGRHLSDTHKLAISEGNKGRIISDQHKAILSKANKGKTISPEHKAKISKIFKGKHLSQEHKAKIGKAHKGKTISPESKARMSIAQSNISLETRAKMSIAQKNRKPISDETRAKLRKPKKRKAVQTPDSIFINTTEASKHHNVHETTIPLWCCDINKTDFHYV